ncbi:MAG: TolC family protein [Bacteroidetes bacterium]|nr:TolC family protein [Bacteroidota bacterium]
MKRNNLILIIPLLLFFICIKPHDVSGQTISNDSISLETIIKQVVLQHPSIQSAVEALNAADSRIALAKSALHPVVDGEASYTRIGPVPSISMPGLGSFDMAPANVYNASINYYQNLFDFGKSDSEIAIEKESKELLKMNIEQVKQKLATNTVNSFYTLAFLQESLRIKDNQLNTLNAHLTFVEKRKETGSATQFEVLTTKVKISATESQKLDIITAIKIQQSFLNTLMGRPERTSFTVKPSLGLLLNAIPTDSLVSYAINHRDEIKINKEKTTIAELRLKSTKTQLNPVVSAYASAGGKDGYFPSLNAPKANFTAGLGLKVPIFDAYRNKNSQLQAKSSIISSQLDTEVAKRNVINEVVENDANLIAALKKIEQFKMQLLQAQEALSLAETSYQNGSVTNLDLLDATTSLSESKLLLLKAKIDYAVGQYRLKVSLGDQLY